MSERLSFSRLPWKRPIKESLPGPPFNQRVIGSVEGLLRDSKNQKNTCTSGARLTKPEYELTPGVVSQTPSLPWHLIRNVCAVGRDYGLDTSRFCRELSRLELEGWSLRSTWHQPGLAQGEEA